MCEKAFSQPFSLKNHEMHHRGETPFVCEVCNKGFIKREQYLRHQNTHTGQRPFSCELCSKSFYSNGELLKHNKTSGHLNNVNLYDCKRDENTEDLKCESTD